MFDMSWLQNLLGGLSDPAKLDLLATEAAGKMDPNVMLPAFGQAKDSMAQLGQQVAQPGMVPPSQEFGIGTRTPNIHIPPAQAPSVGELLQTPQAGNPRQANPLTETQRQAMLSDFVQSPPTDIMNNKQALMALLALGQLKGQGQGGTQSAPAASANPRGNTPMVGNQGSTALPFTQGAGMPSLAALLRGR